MASSEPPPYPPPGYVHHLCHILFWLGFTGPAITFYVAKRACCHCSRSASRRSGRLWHDCPVKTLLLSTFVVKFFGGSWKFTFLEHSATQEAHEIFPCACFRCLLHTCISSLNISRDSAKNRPFVFTDTYLTTGKYQFHI